MESGDLEHQLRCCKDQGLDDCSLPIDFGKDGVGASLQGPSIGRRYTWLQKSKRNQRKLFLDHQWSLTIPVFGAREKFRFELDPSQRLPFLEEASGPEANGFFGEVSRAVIHASHIVDHPELPRISWKSKKSDHEVEIPAYEIAIKRLKRSEQVPEVQWERLVNKERENLNRARELESRHLIKPIAVYERKPDRCFIFSWADGGNLGDYWEKNEAEAHRRESVLWLLGQFVGICSALQVLHGRNVRHGDLKPENMLLFKRGYDKGCLQIADLGLTTFYEKGEHTDVRVGKHTNTPSGTRRYKPPEVDGERGKGQPRSRQYDVWSFGCILLELLVWLVCGYGALEKFRKGTSEYFWQRQQDDGKPYKVHEYVFLVMTWLDGQLEAGSAYKDILKLIQEKLLVIPVSVNYAKASISGYRHKASEVHPTLRDIYERSRDREGYLEIPKLTYPLFAQVKDVVKIGGKLAPSKQKDHLNLISELKPTTTPVEKLSAEQPTEDKLNDGWASVQDNDFATNFFEKIGWDLVRHIPLEITTRLCDSCNSSNSQPIFDKFCDVAVLQGRARNCNLCSLLQDALEYKGIKVPITVELRQDAAHVGLKDGSNLLSFYCEPDSELEIPHGAQFGLPILFDQTSPEFFALLKEWILVCDSDHDMCYREEKDAQSKPTRLIEIGQRIRLLETANIHSCQYIALSHCWGPLEENEKFCTYKRNIEQLKTGIDFEALPPTFRDAVIVACGLGIDYIWIDSLCIIQDDDDDWQRESAKMELVFSMAYCTIGASSAKSSLDGFLHKRTPRTVVKLPATSTQATYACIDIDDFHADVELSALNSRGWVLQERALSRRTIFFTSTQVYWECGAGIRCETLARIENSKVALLGDANFPNAAVAHYRDGRQLLIQDLYERYSGLAFTKPADRSVAILGLQERLARTFGTRAAYGLFEEYFARGLLWKRRYPTRMRRIDQPPSRRVPSWSSLSKEGGIQYMDATTELRFREVNWAVDDFKNPFSVVGGIESASFLGFARKVSLSKYNMLVKIAFDDNEEFAVEELRCVVIGRDKIGDGKFNLKCHVLVIHQSRNASKDPVYERAGVASLEPAVIGKEGSWVTIC
ncbi:hypothetical protein COCMIDRAFT_38701 [Bipolaris oryzae ATCC 44560]|uniref:Protein kinase domain-containing protein n=1 Tax=Bipolaris oryzae ATCC 44560 TaxID=930090 RepID=W6Z0X0_COCMI|nr:uncharacterized protein COCMIDRAFT_38701 [Bipolaris oryzae ATCC 44560]EUC43333.1 hypothetical protein COCMIDRAFT_38701 [Bipolaris oryzae ATCC 44560]